MTKHFAVIGSPIWQSRSPQIHRAAFEYFGVDADYSRVELSTGLSSWLKGTDIKFAGLSVTMPLKEEALALADRLDPVAVRTDSCNTLFSSAGKWTGYNTDVIGLQQTLREVPTCKTLILGSGATSRSAFEACLNRGDEVQVWARNRQNLTSRQLAKHREDALGSLSEFALVISTIPIAGLAEALPVMGGRPDWFFSAAYGVFPQDVESFFKGSKLLDGREMLIWQAVAQQAIFAEASVASYLEDAGLVAVMRKAINKAVEE